MLFSLPSVILAILLIVFQQNAEDEFTSINTTVKPSGSQRARATDEPATSLFPGRPEQEPGLVEKGVPLGEDRSVSGFV